MNIDKQDKLVAKLNMDIMNIPCNVTEAGDQVVPWDQRTASTRDSNDRVAMLAEIAAWRDMWEKGLAYKLGHRDARHAAAELVNEHAAMTRAAQPESATLASQEDITGTTGASIDTPEFRELLYCLDHTLRRAWASRADDLIAHIDAIIGDLRAQLAAKGQGEPVAEVTDGYMGPYRAAKVFRKADVRPGDKLYLSAPASAQPDRGAAQGDRWQVVPKVPTKEMIDNIAAFVDGHENDAEVIYRAMLAAAPSPASQPVAPEGAQASGLIAEVQGCFRAAEVEGLAIVLAETTDLRLKDLVERRLMHALYAANDAAVAPSDAKGKADAAIAGGLREAFNRAFLSWNGFHTQTELAEEWGKGLSAVMFREGATSTADAKDAARYRWLRAADWDDITSLYWSPQVQHAGTPEDCMLKLDEAIDAAVAAAPSSEKGNEK